MTLAAHRKAEADLARRVSVLPAEAQSAMARRAPFAFPLDIQPADQYDISRRMTICAARSNERLAARGELVREYDRGINTGRAAIGDVTYLAHRDEVMRMRNEGMLKKDIAEKCGLSVATISRIYDRAKHENARRKLSEARIAQGKRTVETMGPVIAEMVEQGMTHRQIAAKIGMGDNSVSRILRKWREGQS